MPAAYQADRFMTWFHRSTDKGAGGRGDRFAAISAMARGHGPTRRDDHRDAVSAAACQSRPAGAGIRKPRASRSVAAESGKSLHDP